MLFPSPATAGDLTATVLAYDLGLMLLSNVPLKI